MAFRLIDPSILGEQLAGIVGLLNLVRGVRLDPFHICRFLCRRPLVGDVI